MSDGKYRKARRGAAAMRKAELCGYGEAGRKHVSLGHDKPHAVRVTGRLAETAYTGEVNHERTKAV